jgi:hypothetical protein
VTIVIMVGLQIFPQFAFKNPQITVRLQSMLLPLMSSRWCGLRRTGVSRDFTRHPDQKMSPAIPDHLHTRVQTP